MIFLKKIARLFFSSAALFLLISAGNAIALPSVNGTQISWPNDGWYQVQTADGSQSICNGGSSCDVMPGVYLVINHTTGERFDGIEVEGDLSQGIMTPENFQMIFEGVVERLYNNFYKPAFDSMQFTNDITLVSESTVGIRTERIHTCSGGGVYENSEEIGGTSSVFSQNLNDCRAEGVLYNGSFESSTTGGVGNVQSWTNYSAISSNTDQVNFTYEISRTFATVVRGTGLRISNYELISNNSRQKVENLRSTVAVNADQVPISGSFEVTVLDGLIDNETFRMSTLENFTDMVFIESNQIPVYTRGQLEIVAADANQNRMIIDANNGDPETFIASIEVQGTVSSFIVPWSERNILPCEASACNIERN